MMKAIGTVLGLGPEAFPMHAEKRAQLARKIGAGLLVELEHLAKETDPQIFSKRLMAVANREQAGGGAEFAARAYGWLAENAPHGLREQAAASRAAIEGRGSFGDRAELLLRGFAEGASDPANLLAMAAGGAVYRATRLAVMGRLSGGAGLWGRGMGLRLAAGTAGLAAEAPTFTAVGRLTRGQGPSGDGLREELLSSYLVLGGLKAMGGWAGRVRQSLGRPELARWIGAGGMYGGIMLGHGLETVVGLRAWRPGGVEWMEGLVLLAQFQASGRILSQLGGERYRAMERGLEYRAESLAEWGSVERVAAANDGRYPRIDPAANGPHLAALDVEWKMAAGADWTAVGAEEISNRGLRLLASNGGADEGDTGGIPRPRFRPGRPPVDAGVPAANPAPPRSLEGLARSGKGWAYLSDYGAHLFRLQISEIPDRKGGILPSTFVAQLQLNPVGERRGQLTVTLETLRDDPGYPRNLLLQVDFEQWRDLGFEWPETSRIFPVSPRQVVALESSETVLETLRRDLEIFVGKFPWNEGQLTDISKLVAQVEDFRQLTRQEVPWLDRFYSDYGERLRAEVAPTAPIPAAKDSNWQAVVGAGRQLALRSRIEASAALGHGSEPGVKTGVLMGGEADSVIKNSRGEFKVQKPQGGLYTLRLQYLDQGRYQDVEIKIGLEKAKALGFKTFKEYLVIPMDPLRSVEVRLSDAAIQGRPWVGVALPNGARLDIQADWKKRNHVLALEAGSYGVLVPHRTIQGWDREFLPPDCGKYPFTIHHKDGNGRDRQADVWIDAKQASELGFESAKEGLLLPHNSYLLVKLKGS